MGRNAFLKPYYVIPATEFISAFVESSCRVISHMFMELHTVSCQIFVFRVRVRDTGIQIDHILKCQSILQRRIKFSSDPLFSDIFCYVDRRFHRPVAGVSTYYRRNRSKRCYAGVLGKVSKEKQLCGGYCMGNGDERYLAFVR